MSEYVPMYDNVGIREQTTPALKNDVTYTKLSPDTLLKQRTVSQQYQVPSTDSGNRLVPHQKKSSLFIVVMSVLLTLLAVGTLIAVTLASVEMHNNTKLSAQLQEMRMNMVTVKEEVSSLHESLVQISYEKCFKDTSSCDIKPRSNVNPYCETKRLPVNITVSNY